MSAQKYMVLDYETLSLGDLKKIGAYEYAVHASTRIRCLAFRIGTLENLRDKKTKKWGAHWGTPIPAEFINALFDPDVVVVAHNAGFERLITEHVLPKHTGRRIDVPISRYVCTMALGSTHALPRGLEGACDALKLPIRKDPRGKKLVRTYCLPRKPTKKNKELWNNDHQGLEDLLDYCATDVDAETELFLSLPPLIKEERRAWELNQLTNTRGISIDRDLVLKVLDMIREETRRLDEETKTLTGGAVQSARQTKAVLNYLLSKKVSIPNMQKKTVESAIASGIVTGSAKRLLEIRLSVSKTSTGKYVAFEQRSRSSPRLRDMIVWHGASTGRDAGSGVQPHNFPKGTLKDTKTAIEVLHTGDLEWVRAILGDPMAAFSSCLRGVFKASPGQRLYCADFNAIEARVLFWMAHHTKGVEMFARGEDLYVDLAAVIYDCRASEIGNPSPEREVGKRGILGCGFGMGWAKFAVTCRDFGMPVTDGLAKKAVKAYRTKHAPVVRLWSNLEKAAIAATLHPNKVYSVNRTKWFVKNKFLYCELPSGRRLAFYGPEIRYSNRFGKRTPVLYHWGVHPKTKKWVCDGTYGAKICENVIQGTARDFMVASQLRTHDAKYKSLITIHDELLNERKKGFGNLKEFETLMAEIPAWGKGCPLKVAGWEGPRYKK